jgi:YebC/PmpR family DNA-binding regulatory protein
MSGHSKWSTIKHKKAKTDAQRGKMFSKLVRELMVAAKVGGADLESNARLRLALQKAKAANMPNDNIKRAIDKGAGGQDTQNIEEMVIEAYAPFGVALLIEAMTDNKNRTVPNVRSIINKAGGSLAAKGAVSYLFEAKGLIVFSADVKEEDIMDIVVEAGAEDIEKKEDGTIEVITKQETYENVRLALEKGNFNFLSAEITKIPSNWITLDEDQARKIMKIVDKLEEDDDVQNVYGNFDFSQEIAERIS